MRMIQEKAFPDRGVATRNEVADDQDATLNMSEEDYEVLEVRVRRKIDLIVLPMMCVVFFMQYLDKQSLAYTSVYGLLSDLALTPTQYSWLTSGFYLTQLIIEIPFIYIMSRLELARTIGGTIIAWGIFCMLLATPKRFAGFLAVRCLLGLAETIVAPAFITLVSIWYRKEEHPLRVAAYVSCNGLAQIVGSFMMYGIGEAREQFTLAPWRIMFLICGGVTIFVGVIFYFAMPAGPDTAWFLTEAERAMARQRMARYQDGGDHRDFSWPQLKEAATDLQSLHAFMFGFLVTMTAPVLTFATLVIRNLGYSPAQTLLYGSPSGAVQVLFIWIGVLAVLGIRRRFLVIMLLSVVPFVGCILLYVLPASADWGIIVASWMASISSSITVIFMSLLASNIRGNTKKATINALFNIGYCVGFIAGPQLWTKPPRYQQGVITTIVCWILLGGILIPWYWWLATRRNRLRDRRQAAGVFRDPFTNTQASMDLTDRRNPDFRYTI